ncbi:MAG: TonB-dependent receptor, partial [Cytophagales bacterium]
MNQSLRGFIILFYLIGLLDSFAQGQHELETINIIHNRKKSTQIGFLVLEQDSLAFRKGFFTPLDKALFNMPSVNIRSYGSGNISGISVRGGSTSQTAVAWNGINLQSQFNGMGDLSMISNLDNHQIELQLGGSSGLVGSGAIAGTLFINSIPDFDSINQLNFSFQAYDFDQKSTQANYKLGNQTFQLTISPYAQWGNNNYRYRLTQQNDQVLRQKHGRIEWLGQHSGLTYKFNPKTTISIHSWVQDAERLVPNPSHLLSTAQQKDFFSRNLMSVEHRFLSNLKSDVRIAHLQEKLVYEDLPKNLHSPFNFNQWLVENDWKLKIKNAHIIIASGHLSQSIGRNVNHRNGANTRIRKATFLSYHFKPASGIDFVTSTAIEQNNRLISPLSPSFGMNVKVYRGIFLKGNISKTYRMPTFNDLFWKDGGNENLNPETGLGKELGFEVNKTMGEFWHFKH